MMDVDNKEKIEEIGEKEKEKAPRMSSSMYKKIAQQGKNQQKMMSKFNKEQVKKNRILRNSLDLCKKLVGKEAYNDLKEICTLPIPEKKDEKGEIIQKASSFVNKVVLLRELKNLIIIQREDRIKTGKRKRTSGSSSQRKSHESAVKLLMIRTHEAIQQAGEEAAKGGNT